MTHVLLVDDNETFRVGLALLLVTAPTSRWSGSAARAPTRSRPCRLRPHVVLRNVDMPDTNGIDATAELMAAEPYPSSS